MSGGQTHPDTHPYTLEPPVADRMALETAPRERTVDCYIVTHAAQRALSLLSERLESGAGEFFWLGDPAGAGKTHFLNYFLALRQRLAVPACENGRELVLAFDYPDGAGTAQLENDILAAIARELGEAQRRGVPLWRRIGAQAAFEVAMGEARRAGVRAFTIGIDFGLNETPAFAADLVRMARASKRPSLIVVAAGRDNPPCDSAVAEVGPSDLFERLAIALGRARRLGPHWTAMTHLYQPIQIEPLSPEEIFPFHPETLPAMAVLAEPGGTIAILARMARGVLSIHRGKASLIYPCDLFEAPEIKAMIDDRLGAEGRRALGHANAGIQSMPRPSRNLAEQIAQTLVLAYLCGRAPALEIDQLWERVPPPAANLGGTPAERSRLLHELAARSGGAIIARPLGAGFVPVRESVPGLEEFNQALPLLKLFDPGARSVRDGAELDAAIARIDRCLSNLIEEAQSVIGSLERFAKARATQLEPAVARSIDEFVELAQRGAKALIAHGASEKDLSRAHAVVAGYQDMVAAASSVPVLLAMMEYIQQTGLEPEQVDRREAPEAFALATERSLLEAELGSRAPYSRTRDSLRARFEKFKWAYIEQYRAAHDQCRREMAQAAARLIEIDRFLQALVRLDSIPALGLPLGAQFEPQAREALGAVRICNLEGQFDAYTAPVCPQCGYVLGTPSPEPGLAEMLQKIRAAVREKLAMLSRDAIARLIKKYDHAHRLDGFLKITQAAQTEALAAVLDDQLTAYLARLLLERGEGEGEKRTGTVKSRADSQERG